VRRRIFDSAVAATNSEISNIAQLQPAAVEIVPAANAAIAPLLDKERVARAIATLQPAATAPATILRRRSDSFQTSLTRQDRGMPLRPA
jgi:hypothetical protein